MVSFGVLPFQLKEPRSTPKRDITAEPRHGFVPQSSQGMDSSSLFEPPGRGVKRPSGEKESNSKVVFTNTRGAGTSA